jgi:hypothetical protein
MPDEVLYEVKSLSRYRESRHDKWQTNLARGMFVSKEIGNLRMILGKKFEMDIVINSPLIFLFKVKSN